MSSFTERVKSRPGSVATMSSKNSDNHYPVVPRRANNKTYNMFQSQLVSTDLPNITARSCHLRVAGPIGSLSGDFLDSNAINEFKLDCNGKKFMLKDVYLLINLKNNYAGGTTTLSCLEQCFDNFSVSANGDSTELDHVDSIDWFNRNYLNLNNEELSRYGSQSGLSTSFAHSRTIAPGATTGLLPVRVPSFWNDCDFYLPYFKQLNFKFNNAGSSKVLVSTGTGGAAPYVQIIDMQMLFVVEEQSEHAHIDLMERLNEKDGIIYRVIYGTHTKKIQALQNGTNYDFELPTLRGIFADLMFCFRQSENSASSANITFENVIDSYDIKDSGNASLYAGVNKLATEVLYIDSLNMKSAIFGTANRSIYVHQFTPGGLFACEATKTKVLGLEGLDDCHLNINTNSTPAGNTYTLDIIGHMYAYLYIDNDGKGGPANVRLVKS